ncbi:hypothetical protein JCM14469_15670 [Desulfatiferula olefinivorans]
MRSGFIDKAATVFVGLGLVLIALTVILALLLNTAPVQRRILSRVGALLPGNLAVTSLNVALFSGALDARGVSLADPAGRKVIALDRLLVNVSLFPLLFRTVAVEEVRIEGGLLFLDQDHEGAWNLIRALPGTEETPSPPTRGLPVWPWNLTIASAHLDGGPFRISRSGRDLLTVDRVNLTAVDVNPGRQTGRVTLSLESAGIAVGDTVTTVDRLRLDAALKRGRLSLSVLDVDGAPGTLAVRGRIEDLWAEPRLDLSLSLSPDLAELDRLWGGAASMAGHPDFEVTVSGTARLPKMSLSVHGRDLSVLGRPVASAELRAGLVGTQVVIDRLALDAGVGEAVLSGQIDLDPAVGRTWPAMVTAFDPDAPVYDLHLEALIRQAAELPGLADVMKGALSLTADLDGTGLDHRRLRARARLLAHSADLALWDAPAADYRLSGDLVWADGRLSVTDSRLESAGSRLDLTAGYLRLDDVTWGGRLTLAASDLARLALIAPYARSRGVLNLDSIWEGRGGDWTAQFTGMGRDLDYEGVFLGELDGRAVLDSSGMLHLPAVSVTHDGGAITARGRAGLFGDDETLDLSLVFDHLDVARMTGRTEVSARAGGRLDLSGTVSDLKAGLHLTAPDLTVKGVRVGDLTADADLAHGAVTVSDLTVSQGASLIRARGRIQLFEPKRWTPSARPSGNLTLTGDQLNLADLYPGLEGLVSVDARVEGSPDRLGGHIRLQGQHLSFSGQGLDRVTVSARFDGPDLVLDRAEALLTENESLSVTGKLSLPDARYALALTSSDLSFKPLTAIAIPEGLEGRFRLDLAGEGSLTDPAFEGTVEIGDLSYRRQSLGPGRVHLSLADNVLDLSGLFLGAFTARLDLDTLDGEGEVRLDQADLGPVCAAAGYPGLGGRLSARITARGEGADVSALVLDARVDDFDLRAGDISLVRGGPLRFTLEPSGFDLPDTRLSLLDRGELVLGAGGQVDGELRARAEGTVPMAVLEPFVSGVNALDGRVSLSVSLSGNRKRPDVTGEVRAENVSFVISELMQTVHGLNGLVRVTPRALVLEELAGFLDTGRFTGQGRLALDHLTPGMLSLTIRGDALPLSLPDTLDLTADTAVTVSGTPDKTRMEGALMIVDGRYYRDLSMNLLKMVGGKSRETAPERPGLILPYLKNMDLDLSLRHRNPFVVDNNLALVELKPDLRLSGTLRQPLVSGRAQVGGGVVSYQGREFEVTRGVMDFLNPYAIEPTLDVECRTEIRTWTVTLSVSGTPDNLKFTLTSDPKESDEDVLALLLFGKTTGEMRNGGGDSSQSAALFLADAFSRRLAENLKDATGMDTVEVAYGGGSDANAEGGVSLTFGKDLSERLTIKYGVESRNAEAVQRAVSEYRFFENLMINAYQDTANDFGTELVYRLEFR